MKLIKFSIAVLILSALAACAVGPDYVRPAAVPVVPPAFKEISGWKVAEPKDDRIKGPWWKIYGDPLLNSLEDKVIVSNQNIKMAEAQFRQARALVMAARSAYFPTIGIGVSFSRSSNSTTTTSNFGIPIQRTNTSDYSLPVSASWEPDIWGKVRRSVESNRANAQASAADLAGAMLSYQTELAQDYFQLRALDAQKKLFDTSVALYEKSLELTTNRYNAGVASQADIAQADTLLKTTKAQAIDIGVQRAQLEHAVALLTGTPASSFSLPALPLETSPPAIPVGVPSELLERRPDVAAAERQMAAANAQIGVAEAAYYPSLTLSASGGFQSSSWSKWLTWPSRFWSFGPSVEWTIFDGGLRKAQTEEARAAYDANVASYRETTLVAFQEVEDNLAALRILEEEAAAEDEAVKAAKRTTEIITNQYKAGTAAYLNVITAQTAELGNERTAINVLGQRLNASVLLIKALGGGWDASSLPQAKELTTFKNINKQQ
jgi:NodT family efflux transporter outer membrane factor (OMF) lipoprotein